MSVFDAADVAKLEAQTAATCSSCNEQGPIMALGRWLVRRDEVHVPGGGWMPVDEVRWRLALFCSVRCLNRFVNGCYELGLRYGKDWFTQQASWAAEFSAGDWRTDPREWRHVDPAPHVRAA